MASILKPFQVLNPNGQTKPLGAVKINWANAPRGLQTFWLNNDPNFPELVKQGDNSYNGVPQIGMTAGGLAFDPTLGTNPSVYVPIGGVGPAQCSVEAWIYFNGGTPTYSYGRVSQAIPDGGAYDRVLGVAGGQPYFYTTANYIAGSAALIKGLHHLVGATDGSFNTIYVDGVQVGSIEAVNGGYTGFTIPVVSQGWGKNDQTGTSVTPADQIISFAFADKGWTAAEVAARYADPYSFLVPAEAEMPALFVAAATFQAAWATNSNPPVIGTGTY